MEEWFARESRAHRGDSVPDRSESPATDPYADSDFSGDEGGGRGADDEDQELVISREKQSLLCPLSMRIMEDPWTSRKCGHTYDKESIAEYLKGSKERKAKCPQTGCDKVSSLDIELATCADTIAEHVVCRRLAGQICSPTRSCFVM